jgi:hypothetical protein
LIRGLDVTSRTGLADQRTVDADTTP